MSNKFVLLFLFLCAFAFSAGGQTIPADSLQAPLADSLQVTQTDTTIVPAPRGDINTTINYSATDSIRFDVNDRTVYMFGGAKVDYGKIKLEADRITTNWETTMLTATGTEDSLGKTIGKPVFTDGPQQFVTDNIRYNFKTRKAIIKGIVTQQEEAFIHGETVKKGPDNQLYIENARYTTCNLEDPHFHIAADKLKVLPNDKVISGPFHLKIADVSTPLGFLFGMFPAPRKRVSGIIVPKYGEERKRGFFLADGGYYFAVNEYLDLAITGEIYSKGSRGIGLASNYRKRYAYNGNFNIRYNRQNISDVEGLENISKDLWVTWSHSPQSKGKGRFSASVNGGTSSYTTNNPSISNIERNLQQQFTSSVSYSYNNIFNSPFSISSRARVVQDVREGLVDITLPDIGVSMNRQQPFKNLGGSGRSWYEQIGVGYSFQATNSISNRPVRNRSGLPIISHDPYADDTLSFDFENISALLGRAKTGARHSIPISTSFNILNYFQVSPSITYEEYWFLEKLRYSDYNKELEGIEVDTVNGFSRVGTYSASTGLSTKLFGTFYFNERNKEPYIQAIRHLIIPSIGFSYSPDFQQEKFGLFQEVITGYDRNDVAQRDYLNLYQGFAYVPSGGREQGNISLGVTNNIEMKVRTGNDSTVEYKKVSLLRSLNFRTSYNLIAEEFNLSDIAISGNTSILNNLITLNFGATIDPYIYRLDSITYSDAGTRRVYQEQINEYAWENGKGLGQLTRANFSVTTSLSSATFTKGEQPTTNMAAPNTAGVPLVTPSGETSIEEDMAYIYDDPNEYVDFTLPWTLRFNYSFNYSKVGFADQNITQSANFSGDLKVTDKWKVGFNSGYDVKRREFTQTRLSIYRDLHCWQMNVNWVPFGAYQSFSVDINVKASVLQDLKLSRRRSWFDN
ncbi:putative LPS assembly protein LptD [Nafulsella turpanensis]|uniref:putative LPS assembly protein LptD n=1 Tax=Nafulsella turpanensis TaxID=1265690 RepID=UPI00034C3241|nr:putative LPS assembly protein LptD [Nafulsella turpanensis]